MDVEVSAVAAAIEALHVVQAMIVVAIEEAQEGANIVKAIGFVQNVLTKILHGEMNAIAVKRQKLTMEVMEAEIEAAEVEIEEAIVAGEEVLETVTATEISVAGECVEVIEEIAKAVVIVKEGAAALIVNVHTN